MNRSWFTSRLSLPTAGYRFLRNNAGNRGAAATKLEKRLDVVIIGSPNVGKSILLNRLIETKLAATSRKRHTTRTEILGVSNNRNTQIAFYDTPGYIRKADAAKADEIALSNAALASTEKADVVLLVVDAERCDNFRYYDAFAELVRVALSNAKKEIILVLNKVDLITPKVKLLDTTRSLVSLINGVKLGVGNESQAELDTTTFMVSALQNDGIVDIKKYLLGIADNKPWIIPKGEGVTGITDENRVEQMVLEKLLDHTHDEIPYIANVECTSIVDINLTRTRLKIEVNIWVDTGRQQRIIIGQQGRTLLKIRQAASEDLEMILEKEVILMLYIKLRKNKTTEDISDMVL